MPRTHLQLTAPVASRALLPEDPAHALALAQELLEAPKMSNHTLGLWGYHGLDAEGEELTIQATGLGGAAAAIVLGELAANGVREALRIGTGTAVATPPVAGATVAVAEALALDGASRRLGASGALGADPALTAGLRDAGLEAITVAGVDLPGEPGEGIGGAVVTDLASAPLFALGARLGIAVGAALVVVEAPGSAPIDDQELADEVLVLGPPALAALRRAATSPAS